MLRSYDFFDDVLELRSLFDDFFDRSRTTGGRIEYPYINLSEKDDKIEITAVMPGVKPADINLQLTQDSLIIEGERKSDIQEKPYIRREREFGKFKKSIRLPYAVDTNDINAGLKDGILTIKLIKSEEARPKKIAIK